AEVADRVMETMTREQLAPSQRALDTLSFSRDGQASWRWWSREASRVTGARQEELGGGVNYARKVVGVDVGILFRETEEGAVEASFRSREIVDVGALAQALGGGGHARAAGCTLKGPRERVEALVLERVGEALQQGGA